MATAFNQKNKSLEKLIDFCSSKNGSVDFSYNELKKTLVKYFQLKGDNDPETAADLTLDRIADKMTQGVEIDNLKKYSVAVARFIFLERLNQADRERNAADEFYSDKIIGQTGDDQMNEQMQRWRECFQALSAEERHLLKNYFAEMPFSELNERRAEICAENRISLNNLRLKIFRLRQRLDKCVKNKLK